MTYFAKEGFASDLDWFVQAELYVRESAQSRKGLKIEAGWTRFSYQRSP